MKLIVDALSFAKKKHAKQVRRGTKEPYITHPVAVSYIVAAYKKSKHLNELIAAAILHDVMEDAEVTFLDLSKRFTPLVASLVLELTNDEAEIERVGKLEYQKKKLAGISNYALIIKLADRMHNISDEPTRKMVSDTEELMKDLRGSRKLTKTQVSMVEEIERLCYEKTLSWQNETVDAEASPAKNKIKV